MLGRFTFIGGSVSEKLEESSPQVWSKSERPHVFFERYLENDLQLLSSELKDRYEKIKTAELLGVTPISDQGELFTEVGSVSTTKWRQYNVFQFHIPALHDLFCAVQNMTIEACDYYGIDFNEQRYMVQGWFNITNPESEQLGWHDHAYSGAPSFHGYYSVNAEPSATEYKVFDDTVKIFNIDNRALLSETGHPHRVLQSAISDRITVAYDVIPLEDIINNVNKTEYEQHWIPLA